jgi:D-sedoheptulose 7-phosphate isomerase
MGTPFPAAGATLRRSIDEAARVLEVLRRDERLLGRIDEGAALLTSCLAAGGKIMVCGNGGSACDAAHFAEELTGRFRNDRRPLAALACTDVGHVTCTANDYGFEHVFSRWVTALGRAGDVLIVLSTSGNSANIERAADAGRDAGMAVIGLLGKGGGRVASGCDLSLVVPGETSDRIQELHMLVLHAWVEVVEAVEGGTAGA